MSIINHLRKKVLTTGIVASLVVVSLVFAFVLPNVFAITAYYIPNAAVELDGVNDGSVTISLNTPVADEIFSIEGNFQPSDGDNHFVLTTLTPVAGITPSSNVVSDGRIVWQDSSWDNPIVLGARESMWSATYTVDKNTPAGNYSLCLTGTWISSTSNDNDWATVRYGDICTEVTVTRDGTPPEKPNQVVTFRDGSGNVIGAGGITKYYGDEDFTVTKEVTTGDGTIREYHPDDDGSGRIAHTIPGGDMVGVGEPGDVEICAWLDETENYAETKACYGVHVQKRPLDIVGVAIEDKYYDGYTTDATVTGVTFEDRPLNSEDYEATAHFDDAEAGEGKALHVNVNLRGEAAEHYVLNAEVFNTTSTILPYRLALSEVELLGSGTYGYDPDGVEPGVRVEASTHGGTSTLSEGTDYEVEYVNNNVVGRAQALVSGKGNYTTGDSPIILSFTIVARGINNDNLIVPSSIVEGHILTEDEVRLNVDGHELVRCANDGATNCDYVLEISGENDGIVGHSVHVAVNGRNNYDGVAVADVAIVAKLEQIVTIFDVTNTTVEKSYGDADFTYTATSNGDGEIGYYSDETSVATVDGYGKVSIVGVGSANIYATASETDTYAAGLAKYTVRVSKKVLTVSDVTVASKTFDGTPVATISDATLSDSSLTYGVDFTATGLFNDVGAAVRNVNVMVALTDDAYENYCFEYGSECIKNTQYSTAGTILPFTLSAGNATEAISNTAYMYDGNAKEPMATVSVDLNGDGTKETDLVVGTDYTISYSNNVNAGTATVTVTGTGNYTGSLPALEFTISPFTISADNTSATISNTAYTYNGEAKEPTASVAVDIDGDGTKETTLTAGTDYTISYSNNVNAGTATATITGSGNYAGSLPALEFTISKADSGEPENTPSNLTGEVGKTLAELGNLPEGFVWADETTVITAGMNSYEAVYTKNGDSNNYNSASVMVPVIGYSSEYEVIKGVGQEYVIGESENALFEIDADYELFEGGEVYVDNVLVEPANYESWSNSTVIQFKKEYMDGLALGEHTLAVLFNDGGLAKTTFTVANPVAPGEDTPGAGDLGVFTGADGGAVMTGLTAVAVVAVASVVLIAKKSKKEQ